MTMLMPFETETLLLQNRLGRLVPVALRCFHHHRGVCVVLVATPDFPARQLTNSAEHLAYQLFQRLSEYCQQQDASCRLNAEDVEFIQFHPADEPEWLRWRLQWAGSSPIHLDSVPLTQASREGFLQPILAKGQSFSLASGKDSVADGSCAQVA